MRSLLASRVRSPGSTRASLRAPTRLTRMTRVLCGGRRHRMGLTPHAQGSLRLLVLASATTMTRISSTLPSPDLEDLVASTRDTPTEPSVQLHGASLSLRYRPATPPEPSDSGPPTQGRLQLSTSTTFPTMPRQTSRQLARPWICCAALSTQPVSRTR